MWYSNNYIIHITRCGHQAPSVDNSQPWYFRIRENTIELYHDRTRDRPTYGYNINYFADYVSLGAVIENMRIGAARCGYETAVSYVLNHAHIATLTLRKAASIEASLHEAIAHRHTNRTYYARTVIPQAIRNAAQTVATQGGMTLHWVDERTSLRRLASVLSLHDVILWEDETLRENLLKRIRFGAHDQHTDGLLLDTLGLGWKKKLFALTVRIAQRKPTKLFWKLLAYSARDHLQRQIRRSSAVALLTVPGTHDTHETYLRGGEIFERLWLYLTTEGISVQPIFGPLALLLNVRYHRGGFAPRHARIQARILRSLLAHFPSLTHETPIACLRIGYGTHPHAAAPRRDINEVLQ